ncbi:SpvB/TcaC N-terminal domain-containing protein [Mesoflavibacter zeaxanthinifaciens]|uniref:endonuclease toxin domain-containing protein n=1 Tax=Mesoflavibacter zeaxanthinifaciens TaxID=393060 RepID=UPI00041E24A6|nr:SpvB/TcaC N-terminal domain-containing protein [Mesoflavibacter zeaxanthinifaciens]
MYNNLFKTIRKSYFTGTLLTSLLSNVIVFGQPIQQMTQRINQLETFDNYSNYAYVSSSNFEEKTSSVVPAFSNKEKVKTLKKNTSTVFYALEEQAVIGITTEIEKENPRDNFFTLILPESIDLENHDVVLKYEVYGVSGAEQTAKSINSNDIYGGQVIKLNDTWISVEENLPKSYLKTGKNEIFFNRRADKNYLYKVKDLRIELVNKSSNKVFTTSSSLTNYKDKIYLSGFVDDNINQIEVLGEIIPIKDGMFEAILNEVPKNTRILSINYGKNLNNKEEIRVTYKDETIDYAFSKKENTDNKVNKNNMLGVLSLDALTIQNTVNTSGLTDSQLQIEGINFEELRPVNSDVVNVTSGQFLGYRLKTLIKNDSADFELQLKYDKSKIPDGYTDKDVRTFFFDKEKREWVTLPVENLDYENSVVVTKYNGDTDYINGVIKVPEMAETSSFTPTTITDMKYADPSAGVVSIAPPSPNSNGNVSTSFPIKLPTGRNGMMPSLGINYNSEAGNGWMGVGWNLQLPAITLDTRWGTPRFESSKESEIYQMNGETMVMKVGSEYTNPHRHQADIPRSSNRIFYLRNEGSYLKIVRQGSNPSNYKWEVTDKYGNKSFYGTVSNTVIRDASISSGNITHWALYKTQDPYGNYVIYEYDKGIANTNETNGVTAQYFYPKTIKYTLKGSSNPNYYQVDFLRKDYSLGTGGSVNRTDVTLSARNGVMMAEHELLTEIKVSYYDGQTNAIRGYRFDYVESAFKKMQLNKISEYDTEGNLFYSNTMEYYDEIGTNPLVNNISVTWNGTSDTVGSPLLDMAPSGTPVPTGSALGTSTTSGFSAGLRTGAGIGWQSTSVNNTLGGSYNYSQAKEKTRISFLDINGDGLPDKVYKPNSGGLKYLPNLGYVDGQGSFGSALSVGWNELDETKSKTNTTGVDANLFGVVGAGKSWSTTRTATDGYFTDFNGDGLPDIINNGSVRFNTTYAWETPTNTAFSILADNTSNPIVSGSINPSLIDNLDLETKDELREEHSQFDHVKVWKAPYSGNINIQGVAKLIAKNNCGSSNEPNQFKLTIERATNGQSSGTASQISNGTLTNVNQTISLNVSQSNVTKGDLFFFRVHNKVYGCGGEIEWNPVVTFTSSSNIPNTTNEHDKQFRVFNAEDDYMMNNGGNWSPDKEDNSVAINWNLPNFNQFQFSDNVHFRIEKTRTQHNNDPNDDNYGEIVGTPQTWTWSKTYNHQNGNISTSSLPSGFYGTSNQFANGSLYSYEYRFYVESDSNVQWDEINWQPIITGSTSGAHYAPTNYTPFDSNINQSNYKLYGSSFPTPNIDANVPNDGDNPLLRISHNMFGIDYSQFIVGIEDVQFPIKVNWIIKEEINSVSRVLHKRTFYLHRNNCYDPPFGQPDFCTYTYRTSSSPTSSEINTSNSYYEPYFQFDLSKDKVQEIKNGSGNVYASFYIENPEFGQGNNADISIVLHPNETANYSFSTQILDSPFMAKQPAFYGWTYRGWGQFLYNGGLKFQYDDEGEIIPTIPPTYFDGAIDMSVFNYGADPNQLQNDIDSANPDDMDLNDTAIRYSFYTQVNEFNKYENVAIKHKFNTSSNEYIPASFGFNSGNQLTVLLGRFAEPNIYDLWTDPQTLINGSAFVGLKQRSKSKGKSTSGNVGIGPAGASGTISEANSKVLNQYIDLNGDRYPDIVTDGDIQFTGMKGSLSNLTIGNNFVSGGKSKDDTVGVTISGVAPNSTKSDNNNNTRTNVNSGINTSNGNSYNNRQWSDINGDGLTDRVTITKSEIRVQLNTGYGFANEVVWGSGYNDLYVSTRNNIGVGGGLGGNFNPNASWAAGFGAAESTANLNATLIDVNSDGLPDLVEKTGATYKFYLNNGVSFESTAQQTFYNGNIDRDVSFSGNIYGSFTAGFVIPIYVVIGVIPLKFTFTPTAGVNAGVNEKRITVQDIDGDGYPDVLQAGNDNGDVVAKLNKIGKTNLLKTVNTPLGGSWTVDYKREGNTYNLPQNKWVLNEIKTHDGFTADSNFGPDETLTTISYENPKHDRREREFLGFGSVRIEQRDPNSQSLFRYSVAEYHNDNIYLKGLVKHTAVLDASDTMLNESSTLYNVMNPENPQVNLNSTESQNYLQTGLSEDLLDYSRLFVAPVKTVSTTYEDGDGLSVEQQFTAYDNKGNLLTYKNFGDTYTSASSNDAYRTELEYYNSITGLTNSIGFVKKIQVKRQSDGQLLREREAEYNTQGKLTKVKTKLNSSDTNEVDLLYDSYGNLIKSILQNGFETTVAYDTTIHTYPIQVSNSFNEVSSTSYDYLFGIPVLATDLNGQQLRTRIDNRGRLVEVTAPNEMPNSWTIRMQYQGESVNVPSFNGSNFVLSATGNFQAINPGASQPTSSKHYAVTRHNVTQAQGNQLLTVSLVDGTGSAIQLKKTLYANTNSSSQVRWLVSGKEKKDTFGRVIEAYLPTYQTGYPTNPNSLPTSAFNYITTQNSIPPTIMSYDNRDRLVSIKQPGESQTATTSFSIADGMFLTTATNELGQTFETYTDVRGRQRKSVQNGEISTLIYYNAIDEKVKVRNQQGYDYFYKYDLGGRRIQERHPDRGLSTYKYDAVGNLLERSTSNLLVDGQQLSIKYTYEYNRLKEVLYPQNPENNVKYTYGAPNNSDAVARNAVGRLYMQEDASGVQGFGYDKLGNLNNHLRGVAVAGRHTFWYHTQWTYDSHNRVQRIIYPDGEIVDYNYNLGGTLKNITRTIDGIVNNDPIVSNIKYNNLGERAEIAYGNGTSSSYTYDNRRRLKDLSHQFTGFGITNRYGYDALSNVTSVATQNPQNSIPATGQLGGPISHTYEYDDYNRLIHAEGRYTGPNDLTAPLLAQEYSLDMEYDLAHNIIKKTQSHVQGAVDSYAGTIATPEIMIKTNYHLEYGGYASGVNVVQNQGDEYGYVQPHAPREIIETPDASATLNTGDPDYKKKLIEYDANGNQTTIKQVVTEEPQNAAYEGVVEQQEITLQKNIWDEEDRLRAVDLNPEDKSAHPIAVYTYDASGQRAVRYVPGRLDVSSNANNVSKNERDEVMIYPSPLVTAKALSKPGIAPQKGDLVSNYTKHYYIGSERINSTLGTTKDLGLYPPKIEGMFPNIRNLANTSVQEANTGLIETYTDLEQTINLNAPVIEGSITRFTHDGKKYDAYWYHSDHLGSSSYITNLNGVVTQHIEYLPYGETLVDEHQNSYNTPFKFNGKELDYETGNYYYGSRYYNPKWSVWLSVDPMTEKYPNRSPYEYTFSNPVNFIDPNGMEGLPPEYYMNHQGFWIDGDSSFGEYMGNVKPSGGQGGYLELTKIKGTYYHKNTSNLFAKIGNLFGGDYVDHKQYNQADESFWNEAQANFVGWGIFKAGGLLFNILKRAGGTLWKLPAIGLGNRGVVYEQILEKAGVIKNRFKASNFKTFDAFYKGKAWSVKTLNLLDDTYKEAPSRIYSTFKKYLDDMINFSSDTKLGQTLNNSDIKSKIMEVGIPRGATQAQIKQLNRVIEYGAKNGIKVNVRVIK